VAPEPSRPSRLNEGVRGGAWLNAAAIATWLVCGLPLLLDVARSGALTPPSAVFLAALLVYGAALLAMLYRPSRPGGGRGVPLCLVIVESVTALTVIYVSGTYLRGTAATSALLVIVAAQLPYVLGARWAWAYIAAQTVAMTMILVREFELAELLSVALAVGGFQAFATASSMLALSEASARSKLAATNVELQAAHARLADSSRTEERLRISRDLHDALGHHLTALTLQLDVAARVSEGKAADHISRAHAIARLLLSDVRDVVSTLRETRAMDVSHEVRALTDAPSTMAIHLEMPESLEVSDRPRAEALVRCVQEIITNASRHAGASHLWIRLQPGADGIHLHARDDGRGTEQVSPGRGLTGMHERFAALAGSVEFASRPDAGFEVRGHMPLPRPTR
jgi:signal transduction histidine kinase